MNYESIELTDEIRESLPGKFIRLSDGVAHYELEGPSNGDVVVLVHGFSSPFFVWDPTFKFLVKEGFRVLRYDLFGRGYSDRPKVKYNMDLFIQQLFELVNQLGLAQKKFSLVGLSMGGGICVVFADKYPELVKKVSLIDPIGFPTEKSAFSSLLKIPRLNKLILRRFNHEKLIENQKGDFYHYNKFDEYLEKYAEQMRYAGWLRAIRSTILNLPFTNLKETYERIGKRKVPMQLFWGENDQTIPYSNSQKVCEAIPDILFHSVKECGHMPHYTRPNEVNPLLLQFLRD
ncbi:MAG: alpha/beta fold hydrolase [Promethearchaeota archaeon]